MAALGKDISGVEDIDPFLSLTSPERAVAEAVARSLLHAVGKLFWARNRGYDIRQHLHRFLDNLENIKVGVEQEIAKEERVKSSTVSISRQASHVDIVIDLRLTQTETDVTLTLNINLVDGALRALVT